MAKTNPRLRSVLYLLAFACTSAWLWTHTLPITSSAEPVAVADSQTRSTIHAAKDTNVLGKKASQFLLSDSLVHPNLFSKEAALSTGMHEAGNETRQAEGGPMENLKAQLQMACSQEKAKVSQIWVFAFNSPLEGSYRSAVTATQKEGHGCKEKGIRVYFTASDFNFKFHGRFLLAPMAASESSYLMVVDDDVLIPKTMVAQFIKHMKNKPRVLGTAGQLRSPRQSIEPGWHDYRSEQVKKSHNDRPDQPHTDYLCNIWFIKASWALTLLTRDHPLTWYTGEDIHISYVAKKFLGLSSAVVRINDVGSTDPSLQLKKKEYSANHEKRVADVRNDMFRINLGRGFQPALGGVHVETLVFVQNSVAAQAVVSLLKDGMSLGSVLPGRKITNPACMLFTGREKNSDRLRQLHESALQFAKYGECELYLKPKWGFQPRPIQYFNMRLGLGIENEEYIMSTLIADMIPSVSTILAGGVEGLANIIVVTEKDCPQAVLYLQAIELAMKIVQTGGGMGIKGRLGGVPISHVQVA